MSRDAMHARPTVTVVGAGFSGLCVALHLLRRADGPRVHLVERGGAFGRGVAYARGWRDARLNVRAQRMSAFPDRPRHFQDWLEARGEGAGESFARRAAYGDYLQSLLDGATTDRLVLHRDEAVGLAPAPAGLRLRLAAGAEVEAHAVVLALGNPAPRTPEVVEASAAASLAYVGDPWGAGLDRAPEEGCALLLGTGLTMVDTALRLARDRPRLRLLAVSRHGLAPCAHIPGAPAPEPWKPRDASSARTLLAELRERTREGDWRPVIDGLRPQLQAVWLGWPEVERRRFLRHLRARWDVRRHRIAPAVADALDALVAQGRLAIRAGRLLRVTAEGDGLAVAWRPRGEGARTFPAAALVNCTGPDADPARSQEPLVADLLRQGLVRPHALGLGLDVDSQGRPLGRDGRAHPRLSALGPMTQGAFWEITSVPDIRVQAAETADRLAAELAGA